MIHDSLIREAVEKGLRAKERDICIHAAERVSSALSRHMKENPEMAMSSLMMAIKGHKGELKSMMNSIVGKEADISCEDILCLPCRKTRVIDRVNNNKDGTPEDLLALRDILGVDILKSMTWMVEILEGTIKSKKSSSEHRSKAETAKTVTIPMLSVVAALVADLNKDLAQAIEDRDKYHKLADMLMDEA